MRDESSLTIYCGSIGKSWMPAESQGIRNENRNTYILLWQHLLVYVGFHVVCIFVFRSSASRLEKKSSYFSSFIHQQTERLQVRKPVTEEHLRFLERKLLRVSSSEHLLRLWVNWKKNQRNFLRLILWKLNQFF